MTFKRLPAAAVPPGFRIKSSASCTVVRRMPEKDIYAVARKTGRTWSWALANRRSRWDIKEWRDVDEWSISEVWHATAKSLLQAVEIREQRLTAKARAGALIPGQTCGSISIKSDEFCCDSNVEIDVVNEKGDKIAFRAPWGEIDAAVLFARSYLAVFHELEVTRPAATKTFTVTLAHVMAGCDTLWPFGPVREDQDLKVGRFVATARAFGYGLMDIMTLLDRNNTKAVLQLQRDWEDRVAKEYRNPIYGAAEIHHAILEGMKAARDIALAEFKVAS